MVRKPRKPRIPKSEKYESVGLWFGSNVWMDSRILYVGSPYSGDEGRENGIDSGTSELVIKSLLVLEAIDPKAPITFIMNSPGGSLNDTLAIYDAMRLCSCPITVKAFGECCSSATIILQGADHRLLSENVEFMIHDVGGGVDGFARHIERWAAQYKKLRKLMYKIYASRSNKPESYWERVCADDFVLNAQEAVDLGLADGIILPVEKTNNQ